MSRANESPGARLHAQWARLSPLPGGRWLFSRILGFMVPYTATLRATILDFDPGHVRIRIRERRRLRQHLRSVHAMALANLGELATGLAVLGAMPATVRGILIGFEITFEKKARGELIAEATCDIPEVEETMEAYVEATIRDSAGDTVAVARARWRLGPVVTQ